MSLPAASLRVLHVMAGNHHGGAETAYVDFCLAMKRAGVEVCVATRPNKVRVPMLQDAGIPVHLLPFGGPVDIYTRWRLKSLIRDFRPHIVQTWMARAAQKTPNRRAVPDASPYLVIPRVGGTYKTAHFRESDYFIAITPALRDHLVNGGIAADRITVIPNFAAADEDAPPVSRASLDTPEDAVVLLSLARLHPNKALDIALKALADVPGAYLWLAGEGPDRGMLETLAADLGVADRVRFLGWRTDRAALLKACDICIFPSRVEPFGSVFVQAWAKGTPLIVSDADGPRQFCRNGEDCLMVPRDDAAALAGAIRTLIADPALRKNLAATGHARYQAEFTEEKTVEAYLDYFRACLAQERIDGMDAAS